MYIARLQIDAWDQIYDAEKFLIVSSTWFYNNNKNKN